MASSSSEVSAAEALDRLFAGETLAQINETSQEELEALYAQSCDLVELEDFDGALDVLLSLVAQDPYDFRFQFGYGLCLQQLGRVEAAAKHYALAWILDSSDAASAYRLGECHVALGDRDAAVEAFQTAIALCNLPHAVSEVRLLAESALDRLSA